MTDTSRYTPPEVWVWEKGDSPNWRYSNTNRPVAGATHEKELPRGKHPLQLYSLATPNGVKVTIMVEELVAAGHRGAECESWLYPIRVGEPRDSHDPLTIRSRPAYVMSIRTVHHTTIRLYEEYRLLRRSRCAQRVVRLEAAVARRFP